ncbi:MAG: SusC/RagA family TonB-linked outer membrane protein [Bacteroidota bacterium]
MRSKLTLMLTPLLVLCMSFSFGQEKTISGNVSDENGLPLPGVSVVVVGTTSGTQTDFDGNYTISASEGQVLRFTYLGQRTVNRTVGSSVSINIQMEEDTQALDEVVVVAYGTQKKEEITGSVTTIKAEDIQTVQTGDVTQGLAGRLSGVQIINNTGAPGDPPQVRFRGIGSINSSNEPLYVVDGVVFNGNINSINPQDIESLTVLKDASANALYGSRGANGVILITTKKGGVDKLEVTIDTRVGFNTRATPEYDVITDPAEYYEAAYDRWRIGLIDAGTDPAEAAQIAASQIVSGGDFSLGYNNYNVPDDQLIDPATGQINPNASLLYSDSWIDESYKTGTRIENYVSLRYSNDVLNTFLSIGHLNDDGIVLNSGFERTTARLNSSFRPTEWLTIGGSMNYAQTNQDNALLGAGSGNVSNIANWARTTAPVYPVFGRDGQGNIIRDADGNVVFDFGTGSNGTVGLRPAFKSNANPVATSLLDIDGNVADNFSGRFNASAKFLKDFEFTYNFSADITQANITQFATPIGGDAQAVNGRITTRSNRGITTAHQQLLNWRKELGSHSLSVLLGHESNDFNFRLLQGQVTETVIDRLAVLENGVNIQFLNGYEKDYRVEGYFSRLTYDYDDKYFFNASFRRDGTSVFSPDNRWGNFYGLGVAWSAHKENFLSNADWLSVLRLKASFGQQGNDAILYEDIRTNVADLDNRNYYAYEDQFDIVNAGNNVPGITFFQLGNEDLKWETSTNINAGFELGLFQNRILLNAEYFERNVEDLLFFRPIALSEGVGTRPENVGDMENKGVEVELGIEIIRNSNFNWSLNINGTHFKNEITSLPVDFIDDPNNGIFRLEEGRSRFDFFTREFAGVDPENGDGLWFTDVLDADGNPTGERETTNDRVNATEYFVDKSANPDVFGGFSTAFSYKGFSLDVGFAYQIGGYAWDNVYQTLLGTTSAGDNFHLDVLDSWTPENTTATIPRLDVNDVNQAGTSDFFLIDASFLSLQNATISYSFSSKLVERLGIAGLRIYATGNNLYVWSKRRGFDPRLSSVGTTNAGASINEFPLARTTSMGVTLNF